MFFQTCRCKPTLHITCLAGRPAFGSVSVGVLLKGYREGSKFGHTGFKGIPALSEVTGWNVPNELAASVLPDAARPTAVLLPPILVPLYTTPKPPRRTVLG